MCCWGLFVIGANFIRKLILSQIPTETRIHKLSDYYISLKRTSCSHIPNWSSFSPMDVAGTLPWMAVIERTNENLSEHRIKLIGESLIRLMGKNFTGYRLDEVLCGDKSNDHWMDIQTVVKSREPSFTESVIPVKDRDYNTIIRGCFPFCDENKEIIRLIVVVDVL